MKALALLPLLLADIGPETFNCPEPEGEVTFTEDWSASLPTHIDRTMPATLEVDVVCRVDELGRFVECEHAPRQELTDRQESILARFLPRVMLNTRTTVPNQQCVATKIKFQSGDAAPSEPPPYEAAGERVIPDRTDEDPGERG